MTITDRNVESLFREKMGPAVHVPGALHYEDRRQVWNAMIDRRPVVVVACSSKADVQKAVSIAVEQGLAVSVRGGGHNIAGSAVADGAVMVDLSAMQGVDIDPVTRTAKVQGGATWAHVDAAAQHHGLAVPGGIISETGVGGLTLGGGIGWLARRHGLSIDSLISAEVVLSDGRVVTASNTVSADLFWALRGGGGNFGVVTEFTFRLHEVGPQVCFGPSFFALEDAGTVLRAYANAAQDLPRDACVWANLMTAPPAPVLPERWHGQKVLALVQFHAGDPDQAKADFAPLYGGATPLGSAFARRPFVEAQRFMDTTYPFGARNYWRTHNHSALTPSLIATLLELTPDLPTPDSELLICQLGGAISDVAADATAFAHRQVPFISTPGVRWHDPSDDQRVIGWLKMASDRIARHSQSGTYSNFVTETDHAARQSYGGNVARLGYIKHRYDPGNVFRVNQNIAPTPPPGDPHQ